MPHDGLEAAPAGSAAEHEDAAAVATPLAALQEEPLQAGAAARAALNPGSPPCWERHQVQNDVQQQPPPLPSNPAQRAQRAKLAQPERSSGDAVLDNPDLLKAIISCLKSVRDVDRVARVARLWRTVADDPDVGTELSLEDRSIPPAQVSGWGRWQLRASCWRGGSLRR